VASIFLEDIFICFDWYQLAREHSAGIIIYILYGWGSATWGAASSPTTLPDRRPTLLFLWPRPSNCTGVSRLERLADRAPEALVGAAVPVAEVGGYLAPALPLLADIEGEGEEFEALMPFVWIPGGIGRLTLPGTVLAAVAEGAIFKALLSANRRTHASASKARCFPTLSVASAWFVHLMRLEEGEALREEVGPVEARLRGAYGARRLWSKARITDDSVYSMRN
jgi:hypothetical protein